MRYVDGTDLRERLKRDGTLEPGLALAILSQVAGALDAAHGRGLVHRDVKPANVLLDTGARPDGSDHVYLADFGIGKLVSEEPRDPGWGTATSWGRPTTSPRYQGRIGRAARQRATPDRRGLPTSSPSANPVGVIGGPSCRCSFPPSSSVPIYPASAVR